jgi:apolipoprotein N-acyltransferase
MLLGLGAASAALFHLAWIQPRLSPLVLLFLCGLVGLSAARTVRHAFYAGLGVGFVVYAPHLAFFWGIFGWPAIILWGILAFWLGLFVALIRSVRLHWGRVTAALLVPIVWTGLEYFRSELYYLRFSWLSLGYAFSDSPQVFSLTGLGIYGVGFLLAAVAAWTNLLSRQKAVLLLGATMLALGAVGVWRSGEADARDRTLKLAGVQLEFPVPQEVPAALDRVLHAHPDAVLLVLSEYTFDGPIPEPVKSWCRKHQRHVLAGGKDFNPDGGFYNTAFVIGPDGEVVFQQAKSVPIQFFKDGQPAPSRRPWESPWGKLGICICYDLSYRRVVDDLVGQGAEALIVPTMDVVDWGPAQHRLHARVAAVRAAEYGIPVFRVCSSGISQLIDSRGRIQSFSPCPGPGEVLGGTLSLAHGGRLPLDHWLGPTAAALTGGLMLLLLGLQLRAQLAGPRRLRSGRNEHEDSVDRAGL